MRILLMANAPRNPDSGAAGTEVRTADALRAMGHHVDEIWSDTLGRRIKHGNLHYLLELPRAYRREMRSALQRADYDVVHVGQPHGYLAAKTLHRSGSNAIFVHRSHGFEPLSQNVTTEWERRLAVARPPLPKRAASALMRRLLDRHSTLIARHADGHIVSSTADAAFMRNMGIASNRIAVIPQAAAESFRTSPAPPLAAERLRRFFYVGQFAFIKAPMIVAASMVRLAREHPALQFTWVCSRAHHESVRALLGEQRDRVELLDWMATERLVDVFDRHGIFLFPSFYEGFGKVVLEAMCRGLCVIATRVGGAADVIEDGETGILIEPGDAGAIVAAAESLISDPARAARIAARAAAAGRAYTWERVARETTAFYERLRRDRM